MRGNRRTSRRSSSCRRDDVTAVESLVEQLTSIAGPDRIEVSPSMALGALSPRLAVTPATLEDAAACLRAAADAGAAVLPWGGGTQQRIGRLPEHAEVVLRTGELNQTVEWEPADLTACFES